MWMKPLSSSPMRSSSLTRTSSKNSSAVSDSSWPTLSSLRPREKPSATVSTPNSVMPLAFFSGAVRAATTTRSAQSPLVMNVLDPLMHPVVAVADRGGLQGGQVGAAGRLGHPDRGEELAGAEAAAASACFCSSVVRSTRYGATMSAWMPTQDGSAMLTLASSSVSTALKR